MQSFYYKFSDYLKMTYGTRVQKIAVSAGFTCPNRDGTKGQGGCIFCNNAAFSPSGRSPWLPLVAQIEQQIEFYHNRRNAGKFFVYFQSFSNTYAPINELKSCYDVIYQFADIVALAVGTRPDCISENILDLLESYSPDYDVWIEYGLESAQNRTLALINRCHTFEQFQQAVAMTRGRNMKICTHLILGLPGESRQEMLETAQSIATMKLAAVKLHPIQVIRDTRLAQLYQNGDFAPMEFDEYVELLCDFLEYLPPQTIIQRVTADAPPDYLIAPSWCFEKQKLLEAVTQTFSKRGTRQGTKFPAGL